MSTFSLRLPDSLHEAAKRLAKRDKTSLNQLITLALAEKISALETEDFLAQRAKHGSRDAFEKLLDHIPDVEPPPYDRI